MIALAINVVPGMNNIRVAVRGNRDIDAINSAVRVPAIGNETLQTDQVIGSRIKPRFPFHAPPLPRLRGSC
jgi:hypothetical protein